MIQIKPVQHFMDHTDLIGIDPTQDQDIQDMIKITEITETGARNILGEDQDQHQDLKKEEDLDQHQEEDSDIKVENQKESRRKGEIIIR